MAELLTYSMAMRFEDLGYIGDPFWTEVDQLINITKQSGMNRAKSDANRRKALEEHLKRLGMTLDDYEALEKRAKQPFYYWPDGEIMVPKIHIEGFLVNTASTLRAASRPCPPEQARSVLKVIPWHTGKHGRDGVFERFAKVTSGTGAKLSNQRGLRKSDYIKDFTATGEISFRPEFVKPSALENAIRLGGESVGIGASRKMGYGRFVLVEWKKIKAEALPEPRAIVHEAEEATVAAIN